MSENQFTQEFEITTHMTDFQEICKAAELLRFMQESAVRQLDVRGPSQKYLLETGRAFILSRITMDFYRPLHYYDRVKAITWPCSSSRGVTFDRKYRMVMAGDDTPIAAASSQWAMVSIADHRLQRYEDTELTYSCDETVEVSIPLRFRIPKDAAFTEVNKMEVRYSDIDKNGHLNNTHYADMYCDAMMEELRGHYISSLAITFAKEAPLGEVITVTRTMQADENGLYYFRTYKADGSINSEAAIRLSPLDV